MAIYQNIRHHKVHADLQDLQGSQGIVSVAIYHGPEYNDFGLTGNVG